MLGALLGLLVVAGPGSPSPAPASTLAPVSADLTVIWCGAVLGETSDATSQRLGAPKTVTQAQGYPKGQQYWLYPLADGQATCKMRVAEGRVVEIIASLSARTSTVSMTDPYGVSLGDVVRDFRKARGAQISEVDEAAVYPSASGACWTYTWGYIEDRSPRITAIRVFLNLNNPNLNCHSGAH